MELQRQNPLEVLSFFFKVILLLAGNSAATVWSNFQKSRPKVPLKSSKVGLIPICRIRGLRGFPY